MPGVSDLVKDAELETRFHAEYTVHSYTETGPTARERSILREEHWKRQMLIGRGSYGNVWLEHCVEGRPQVKLRAVKEVVKSPHDSKQIDYYRELEAISKFSHRKYERCFVKLLGWYESDKAICIAMEYFQYGDLQRYLDTALPLPESEAQQITFQVLEALRFMHNSDFSHRDLKPGNILVRSRPPDSWWVKVSDFGISKRAADSLTASSTMRGTLRYMAPELLGFVEPAEVSDSRNAPAADMWALGEIVHQMLTKEATFKSISLLFTYVGSPETFPSAVLRAHNVSDMGIAFISSLMRPSPGARPNAAEALLHAWMNTYSSHTASRSSSPPGPFISEQAPAFPLEEPLAYPSATWDTVSLAAFQTRSLASVSSTAARQLSPPETTISFPNTTTNTSFSVNEDTTSHVLSASDARYFILKSNNETNIETSAAHGIWCCGQQTNTRLSKAYNSTSGPIFLIFSVNRSRKFCGVAQMKSTWSLNVPTEHWEDGTWKGGFLVEWLSWTSIGFDDVVHLKHKEVDGVSLNMGRYVLELCKSTGMEMMQRFGVSQSLLRSTPEPSDMSEVGSLGVGRLGLSTTRGTSGSNVLASPLDPDSTERSNASRYAYNPDEMPREMEIDDSEDDGR